MSHPQDLSLRDQAAAVGLGELSTRTSCWTPPSRGSRNATARSTPSSSASPTRRAGCSPMPRRGRCTACPSLVKDMFRLPWYAPRDGAPSEAAPPGESAVYRRLRDAGAVIVGIGQCHYWGAGLDRPRVRVGPVRQPVEPRPLRGRLVGRVGRGGGRSPRCRGGRHRRRRQRPAAVRLLRRHGHEGDLRRDRDGRLHARLLGHGRDRADLPRRGRRAACSARC